MDKGKFNTLKFGFDGIVHLLAPVLLSIDPDYGIYILIACSERPLVYPLTVPMYV